MYNNDTFYILKVDKRPNGLVEERGLPRINGVFRMISNAIAKKRLDFEVKENNMAR